MLRVRKKIAAALTSKSRPTRMAQKKTASPDSSANLEGLMKSLSDRLSKAGVRADRISNIITEVVDTEESAAANTE